MKFDKWKGEQKYNDSLGHHFLIHLELILALFLRLFLMDSTMANHNEKTPFGIPSWELTYPIPKALLKMIFLFPRWDMLVPRGVHFYLFFQTSNKQIQVIGLGWLDVFSFLEQGWADIIFTFFQSTVGNAPKIFTKFSLPKCQSLQFRRQPPRKERQITPPTCCDFPRLTP